MNPNIDLLFIMVDIDHFKHVNDEYGHAAGDSVLRQVAMLLREAARDSDVVVRWGGEEFLVVAHNASRQQADILVERIRASLEGHEFDLGDGRTLRKTCSLGYSVFPFISTSPDALDWEKVVDLADRCLFAAKRGGRNAWVGLLPVLDTDANTNAQRITGTTPMPIAELVQEGLLTIHTSLPDSATLPWGNAGKR